MQNKGPAAQWRTEGPPKSRQTQPDREKLLKIAEFRTPTPQDVRKKGSKILKLPPVRNCFTLAMTNKLVVIINILKVPKIKKILLYEMKFLVPNYSCLQNPWLGGLPPPDPLSLCPQLNLLNPPTPGTKFMGTPLKGGVWKVWHFILPSPIFLLLVVWDDKLSKTVRILLYLWQVNGRVNFAASGRHLLNQAVIKIKTNLAY